MSKLIRQQSIGGDGQNVESWVIEVNAVNEFVARQRARIFARWQDVTIKNILSPEIVSSEPVQTTFSDLFPESIRMETYRVEVIVVR